jgi:hypothetical protein
MAHEHMGISLSSLRIPDHFAAFKTYRYISQLGDQPPLACEVDLRPELLQIRKGFCITAARFLGRQTVPPVTDASRPRLPDRKPC